MKPTATNGWLLDTHALLWMLYGDKRLKKSAKERIDDELPVFYSTVSFWEIALKLWAKGFDFFIEDDWDLLLPRELEKRPQTGHCLILNLSNHLICFLDVCGQVLQIRQTGTVAPLGWFAE